MRLRSVRGRPGLVESAVAIPQLRPDPVSRGLRFDKGLLVVLDGAKALSAAREPFGAKALIQLCILHKRRKVADQLPNEEPVWWMPSWSRPSAIPIPRRRCATPNTLPGDWGRATRVAASPREWLKEIFTVARLSVDGYLAKTLIMSDPVESLISIARAANGDVTRWRDGQMVLRRTAEGMLNAPAIPAASRTTGRCRSSSRLCTAALTPKRQKHRPCRCRRLEFIVDRHRTSTRIGTRFCDACQ